MICVVWNTIKKTKINNSKQKSMLELEQICSVFIIYTTQTLQIALVATDTEHTDSSKTDTEDNSK